MCYYYYLGPNLFKSSRVQEADLSHNNLNYIPDGIFDNCTDLEVIKLNSKLEVIGARAFANSKLATVDIPKTIKFIGAAAFLGCSKLTKIDISKTMISFLSEKLFMDCAMLKSIALPRNYDNISSFCFANTSLTSFTFSESVESIGEGIFCNCSQLESVTMSSIKQSNISNYMFSGAVNLTKFVPPSNIKYIGSYAFNGTSIDKFDFESFKIIGEGSFKGCKKITSVNLENLEDGKIPDHAFQDCKMLSKISWPKTETRIGKHAFDGTSLTKILFTEKVTIIGDYCFANCESLVFVDLTKCETDCFGAGAFSNTGSIVIEWPATQIYYSLGSQIFQNSKITEIKLPKQVQKMESGVCSHCTELKTFDMSQTLMDTIPANAFAYTGELEIKWPISIKSIEERAFFGCRLSRILLPSTVSSLGPAVFSECQRLESIYLNSTMIAKISCFCFSQYSSLTEIVFPATCTSMGEKAFMSTGIFAIVLHETITRLDQRAFFK